MQQTTTVGIAVVALVLTSFMSAADEAKPTTNRPGCRTLVLDTPRWHTRFCTKPHPHRKLLCSWGGGGGGGTSHGGHSGGALFGGGGGGGGGFVSGGGGGGGGALFSNSGQFTPTAVNAFSSLIETPVPLTPPPTLTVPGPIVGSGLVGALSGMTALGFYLLRRRRQSH